jgi:uncharacterized membrane protein
LTVLFAGAADAQTQSFRFRVCNQSNVTSSVAILSRVSTGDNRFVVKGWWTVGAGDCEWIGYFPQGWVYFYAEQRNSGRIYWGGNDVSICIRYPGPWERINSTGYNCRSDEALKGFIGDFISSNTGTYTWTLE